MKNNYESSYTSKAMVTTTLKSFLGIFYSLDWFHFFKICMLMYWIYQCLWTTPFVVFFPLKC
jgi:hypothetical protein